jgi:hypothetical protein
MSTTDTIHASDELVIGTPAGENKSWNWHPDIPIQYSSLFTYPLSPVAIVKWFARAWLPLTELTCYLVLAIVVWRWVQPPLADTQALTVGWAGALWARNFILMALIATVLHLWLYSWHKQGDRYRFMRNAPTARGTFPLLKNQF